MPSRRIFSIGDELVSKSREAALSAVQIFNNPNANFKSESFIVLMVISWTYLMHAYYRKEKIEYRYFDAGQHRRKFHRTKSGAYKHWELKKCLDYSSCPLPSAVRSNLRFLIGLRNEIEHQGTPNMGLQLTDRFLACCLNYEATITSLFGEKHSVASEMTIALQFTDLTAPANTTAEAPTMPPNVSKYIQEFDSNIPDEEFQSPQFSYKLIFIQKLTGNKGQADRAIEFISPNTELAKTINKDYWVQKEVERNKLTPTDVFKIMQREGYVKFDLHAHTKLWQKMKAKDAAHGYGTELLGRFLWYDHWVDVVRKHCLANAGKYQ